MPSWTSEDPSMCTAYHLSGPFNLDLQQMFDSRLMFGEKDATLPHWLSIGVSTGHTQLEK